MRFLNKLAEMTIRADKRPSPELVDKIEDAVQDSTFAAMAIGTAATVCVIKGKIDNARKAINQSINDTMDVGLEYADKSMKLMMKDLPDSSMIGAAGSIASLRPKFETRYFEAALMANHVYSTFWQEKLIGGWEEIKPECGIVLEDEASGLRTRLFSRIENGQRKYCYAIAGTKSITNPKDWIANISQLFGLSFQHIIAVRNAKTLCDYYGRDSIFFVGHSLGGGVAAICSMVTGCKAITFNAAGVSIPTKKHELAFDESNIEALIMEGDELDEIQGVGTIIEGGYHLTRANGKKISVPVTNWVGTIIHPFMNRHQLNHMIESLERYKI